MAKYVAHANAVINHAIQFATMAHGSQVRKGNVLVPYIFHPIDVANEIMYYSGLPQAAIEKASVIGILHDVVEDTAATEADISNQFGEEIAFGVAALTKNPKLKGREQLVENLKRLETVPPHIQVVKLADRVSNLKSFPAMWDRDKIADYLNEASLIANQLGTASETLHARLLMRIAENRTRLSLVSH